MERSRLYKNKNKDSEELRRRRIDQSVELRKAKKDEQLLKRRNILLAEPEEVSPLKERQVGPPEGVNFDSVVRGMHSTDEAKRFEAVQLCRRILSKETNPPIDEFYKRGVVDVLAGCLQSKSDCLVFESAWALTNIASGDSLYTAAVANKGIIIKFVNLLNHSKINIAEQSLWALGNIAGDGPELRDLVISSGVIEPVLRFLERAWSMPSVVSNIAWMLSNLCRHTNPSPSPEVVMQLLPSLSKLLRYDGNENVVVDATWAISYAGDFMPSLAENLVAHGCLKPLISLLASRSPKVVTPAVRAVGNLVLGTDEHTQLVLDEGLLSYIPTLLNNDRSTVVKESCWVLSNITAGNKQQIQMVIEHNLIPTVLKILEKADYKVQKEACWVITNLVNGGSPAQLGYLLNQGVIPPLCNLLNVSDTRIIFITLQAISNILEISSKYNQLDPVCVAIETCGGLDKLEGLQEHSSTEIYEMVYKIIADYFNDENVPEENTLDNGNVANNNEFQFFEPENQFGPDTNFHF